MKGYLYIITFFITSFYPTYHPRNPLLMEHFILLVDCYRSLPLLILELLSSSSCTFLYFLFSLLLLYSPTPILPTTIAPNYRSLHKNNRTKLFLLKLEQIGNINPYYCHMLMLNKTTYILSTRVFIRCCLYTACTCEPTRSMRPAIQHFFLEIWEYF